MLQHTAFAPQRLAPLGHAVLVITGRSAGLVGNESMHRQGRWRG
jgi:hypothetical protein